MSGRQRNPIQSRTLMPETVKRSTRTMTRFRILMAAALPLIAVPALAQQAAVEYRELEDDAMMVEPFALSAGELEDMDIFGPEGEQIGEVEDVMTDATGQITGFAVETEGFIGLGSEDVIVPLTALELEGERFVTTLTEDELENLPEWDD
jgi:PRC-barrel domain